MEKQGLKTILYTVLICIIIFAVVRLFFVALPYLIIAGVVAWVSFKLFSYFKSKKSGVTSRGKYQPSDVKEPDNQDDLDTKKAIDVDFKDAD